MEEEKIVIHDTNLSDDDNQIMEMFRQGASLTSDQIARLSTAVNMSLTSSMLKTINILDTKADEIGGAFAKLFDKFNVTLANAIDNDLIGMDTTMRYMTQFYNMIKEIAELKRKVLISKDNISFDPLTPQERAMLKLMGNMTAADKQRLMDFIRPLQEDPIDIDSETVN